MMMFSLGDLRFRLSDVSCYHLVTVITKGGSDSETYLSMVIGGREKLFSSTDLGEDIHKALKLLDSFINPEILTDEVKFIPIEEDPV